MNETEQDRILQMVSEGTLRPEEAARLLAALAAEQKPGAEGERAPGPEIQRPRQPMLEVQMQRPDGTYYTVQVPPNLAPMLWKMAQVAIRESARTAAQEAWSGFKHIVSERTTAVKNGVRERVTGQSAARPALKQSPAVEQEIEARRRLLQMVQNGRLTAVDAARLIDQMDALKKHGAAT